MKRFWDKVSKSEGCWVWVGGRDRRGYGVAWNGKKLVRAHRLSYELQHGPLPAGVCVLHRCDNPPCINPAHLFLGTQLDNARDREAKGRGNQPKGEKSGTAKLDPEKVRTIRRLSKTRSTRDLAKLFGVSHTTIVWVLRGRSWTHVK